jgi:hypothetical protein
VPGIEARGARDGIKPDALDKNTSGWRILIYCENSGVSVPQYYESWRFACAAQASVASRTFEFSYLTGGGMFDIRGAVELTASFCSIELYLGSFRFTASVVSLHAGFRL